MIGIVCGLAIYNSTVVDLHFPLVLYKKLLDVPPVLDDLKVLSPTEGRYATDMLYSHNKWKTIFRCVFTTSESTVFRFLMHCYFTGAAT